MDDRKSGRMRVESFVLAHTTDRALVDTICQKYNAVRTESELRAHSVHGFWEVRLEMAPGRQKAFTMDEVAWAQGFTAGFEALWRRRS